MAVGGVWIPVTLLASSAQTLRNAMQRDLIGALGEIRARAGVVGSASAQEDGQGRSRVPGYVVGEPPISERVFHPAVVRPAASFAEGEFVGREEAELVAHVKGRKAALRGKVSILLNDNRPGAPDRTCVVEGFRERIETLKRKSPRETVDHADLQGVIDRVRTGLVV